MRAPRPPLDVSPVMLEFPTGMLDWPEAFGNRHPVELEVGPGKGLFLANAGAARPDRNFVGVELSRKYAGKAAERIVKAGLENVRVIAGDARRLLAQHVTPQSLAAVHVYFPDPWWKKRHKKRRVFCEAFVDDVARVLMPGGDFHFATDVEEYFGVMMELMLGRREFEQQAAPAPRQPEHDLDYLTNFERKYRKEGRPIHRAHFRRTDQPAPARNVEAGPP